MRKPEIVERILHEMMGGKPSVVVRRQGGLVELRQCTQPETSAYQNSGFGLTVGQELYPYLVRYESDHSLHR